MRHLRLAAALLLVVLLPLAVSAADGKAAAAPAKAKAPAAPPPAPPNITASMAKGGCKAFAALVAASPDALSTFQSAADGGMTAFCPTDDAMRAFVPTYKNLTADGKASLLLFHAVPVYYSLRSLKSNNGPAESPAPAPAPVADAPKASKSKKASHRHVADAPGPAGDDAPPADQRKSSKKNDAAAGASCLRWLAALPVAVAVAAALA
uniref:FAS1 domain-containing protein n=1 Tax=Oryza barthii TaxID=65489 RepID=A0A0D3H1M0_9ORYZ